MKGKYLHPRLCFRPALRLRTYVLKLSRRPRHTRLPRQPAETTVEKPVEELEPIVEEQEAVVEVPEPVLDDRLPYRGSPPSAQWAKAKPATLQQSSKILRNFWVAYTAWTDVRILDAVKYNQERKIAIDAVNEAVREAQNFSVLTAQSRQDGTAISKLRNYGWNGHDGACCGNAKEARKSLKKGGHGRTFSDDDYD